MSGVARYHDDLAALMLGRKGRELSTKEITVLFTSRYPNLRSGFMQPSDHCINHIVELARHCAGTDKAIFERVARGRYRVR
jgi:hypothetical protein